MTISKKNIDLDQNTNLANRKKVWSGSINFPKTKNISNDPKTLLMGDLLVWKEQPLSQDYLRTISEDARDEIAKDVYNFWLNYDFNTMKIPEKQLKSAWKSLCKIEIKTETIDNITYVSNSSSSGSQIYRHFFPNIIKVRGETRPSVYDVLTDKEKLWQTVRNRIGNTLLYNDDPKGVPVQYPMPQTCSQICIGAKNSGLASMSSLFKCSVAKSIYDKYVKDGDKVLDYSSGFGGRLLGLMSLQRKDVKYCGYEPATDTFANLNSMIKHFDFNAEIKMCGSETELFDDKFDFVLSSPPFFTQEKYNDESTQCYNAYPEYEEWLEKYWRKTVQNIKQMSKPETVLGINAGNQSNEFMKKIDKDMNGIIKEEGYVLVDQWQMKTSKSHLSSKKGNADKKVKLEGISFYRQV